MPVTHALVAGRAPRFSGSTLRSAQQRSGSRSYRSRAVLGVLLGDGLLRQHVDDGDRRASLRDRVAGAERLGEVVAGVEEEHVDARGVLRGDVPAAPRPPCWTRRRGVPERCAPPRRRPRRPSASGPSSPRRPASASARSSSAPRRVPRPPVRGGRGGRGGVGGHRSSSSSARWAQGGERLAGRALVEPAAHDALDVVGQLGGGDLQAAHLAAEAGLVAVGEARPPPRWTWKPSTCLPSRR